MNKLVKCMIVIIEVVSLVFVTGCAKLGQKEVDELLKKKYKNNLVSSSYTVDENNKLGQAEVTFINASGKEVKTIAYYYVTKSKDKVVVRSINTYGIPKKLVTELASGYPDKFKEYIDLYNELENSLSECESSCDEYQQKFFSYFESGKYFELWYIEEAINASKPVNDIIEEYEDKYHSAPSIIKKEFSPPPEYFSLSYDENHYYAERVSVKP